jgi:hypothetical protein
MKERIPLIKPEQLVKTSEHTDEVRTQEVQKSKKYLIYMQLLALQPIKAPNQSKSSINYIVELYRLKDKYGEEIVHADYVFLRSFDYIKNDFCPCLYGSTIKSALNLKFNLSNKKYIVKSACTDEECVTILKFRRTTKDKNGNIRETLEQGECILPKSIIRVLIETSDPQVVETLKNSVGKIINLGGKKSRGLSEAKIISVEVKEV